MSRHLLSVHDANALEFMYSIIHTLEESNIRDLYKTISILIGNTNLTRDFLKTHDIHLSLAETLSERIKSKFPKANLLKIVRVRLASNIITACDAPIDPECYPKFNGKIVMLTKSKSVLKSCFKKDTHKKSKRITIVDEKQKYEELAVIFRNKFYSDYSDSKFYKTIAKLIRIHPSEDPEAINENTKFDKDSTDFERIAVVIVKKHNCYVAPHSEKYPRY